MPSRTLITGANGRLGQGLLRSTGGAGVRAAVRSEAAAATVAELGTSAEVAVVDPTDADALVAAAEGCEAWIHLAGILKEGSRSSYGLWASFRWR